MQDFAARHLDHQRGRPLRILDIGGANVNGSYRDVLDDAAWEYVALDVASGPGVDIVPANVWRWSDVDARSFDVVVSGQAFEHIAFPWVTIVELQRVLKPGGLVCLVVPSTGDEHRYSLDCWRFYRDGLVALAQWADLEVLEARVHGDAEWSDPSNIWHDAVLVARRPDLGRRNAVIAGAKRAVLRRVLSFQAMRRSPDLQRLADEMMERSAQDDQESNGSGGGSRPG